MRETYLGPEHFVEFANGIRPLTSFSFLLGLISRKEIFSLASPFQQGRNLSMLTFTSHATLLNETVTEADLGLLQHPRWSSL